MQIEFHDADDEHAPFPHRVITHIICAECDHLITRWIPRCECEQKCHELARLIAEMDGNETLRPMVGDGRIIQGPQTKGAG